MAESMPSSSPLEYSKLLLLAQRPSFKPTTASTGRKLAPARRCTKKNGCKKRWFTADEKTLLRHLVLDNESVILSRKNDGVSVHLKKEVWLSIADQFNEHPQTVTQRNSVELRRCWENMKFKAKKTLNKVRQQLVAAGATGSSPIGCLGSDALKLLANSRQAFKKPYDVSPNESETEMFQGPNLDSLSATIALQDNDHFQATFERHAQDSDEENMSSTSINSQTHLLEQRKRLNYPHLNLKDSLEYLSSCPSPHPSSQNMLSNSLPLSRMNPSITVSSGGFISDKITNLDEVSHSETHHLDALLHTTSSTECNMALTSSSTSTITQTNLDNINSHSLESSMPLFYSISKCSVLPKSSNFCIQGSFPVNTTALSHNPLFPFASVASSAPIPAVLPLADVGQGNNTSHCETHKSNESTTFSGASCQTNAVLEQSNDTPLPMLCDQTNAVSSDDGRDSAPLYARNGYLSAVVVEQPQSLACPETLLQALSRPVLQTPRLLQLLRPGLPGSITDIADVLGNHQNSSPNTNNCHQWIDNNSASGVISNSDDLPTDLSFGTRLVNSNSLVNEAVACSVEIDYQENDDRTCSPHAARQDNDGVAGLDLSNKRNNSQQQRKGGQDVGGTINGNLDHDAPSKGTHLSNDDNKPLFSPSLFLMPSSFDMKPFTPELCVPSYGFSPMLSQFLPNIFSVTNSVSTSFPSQMCSMFKNPESNIFLKNSLTGDETIPTILSSVNSSNPDHLPEVTPLISTPSGPDPSAEAPSSNAAPANTAPTADIDALMAQLLNVNGADGAVGSDAIASSTDPSNLDTVVAEALGLRDTEGTATTNSSCFEASLVATLRSENALLQQRLGLMEEQRQQATIEHQQRMQLLQQEHQERLSLIAQELAIKRMLCQLHIEYALNNSTK